MALVVKNLPAMQERRVPSLGQGDPMEEGRATHFSILGWRIPMDRGAWRAAVHGDHKELDTTERLRTARNFSRQHRTVHSSAHLPSCHCLARLTCWKGNRKPTRGSIVPNKYLTLHHSCELQWITVLWKLPALNQKEVYQFRCLLDGDFIWEG